MTTSTATIALLASGADTTGIEPLGVNDSGEGVGFSGTPPAANAYLWTGSSSSFLRPLAGYTATEGYSINDTGQMVGASGKSGTVTACLWTSASVSAPTLLGGLPGSADSIAAHITNTGLIVGSSYSSPTVYSAVTWQNGQIASLPGLGGSLSQALSANDSGLIVGSASTSDGTAHAVSWQNGQVTELANLPFAGSSSANAVNASGVMVGGTTDFYSGITQATLWENGTAVALGFPADYQTSVAAGINDQGIVVGEAGLAGGGTEAVAWYGGVVVPLIDLLPKGSAFVSLTAATAINNQNQIVGYGITSGYDFGAFEIDLPAQVTVSAALAATNSENHTVYAPVAVTDNAANIVSNLDALEYLRSEHDLASITLTDSGTVDITVTAQQMAQDTGTVKMISGPHTVTVQIGEKAAQFSFANPSGFAGVTALQFTDQAVIVAAPPGPANAVTTGNITELYSAVLAREPDVGGLGFYQTYLQANPNTPLLTFAQFFLTSTEYSSAHNYAQTTAGETQFIDDSYQNLLHRAPSASEVNFYLTNVLTQSGGQLQNHAQMLVYFSASAEFLSDVQITALNPVSAQHWLVLT